MKHDIDVIDRQTGATSEIVICESTDECIKWLADHAGVSCMVDGVDRCEWEFEYLPGYPTEWRN